MDDDIELKMRCLFLVILLINLVGNNRAMERNGACYYLIAYDTCKHVTRLKNLKMKK